LEIEDAVQMIRAVAPKVFPNARVVAATEDRCGKVAIDTGDLQIFVSVIPGSVRGVTVAKFVRTPFLGCSEAFMTPEGLIAVLLSEDDADKVARKLRAVAKMPQP